jgi:hypothetical protein
MDETECLEYKSKKYPRCDQLRYRRDDKESLRRDIALDDTEGYIDTKCYQIGKTEKYPHECYTLEEKCEKIYHREVKYHPDKSLKSICHIEVPELLSAESSIGVDHHRILIHRICDWRSDDSGYID